MAHYYDHDQRLTKRAAGRCGQQSIGRSFVSFTMDVTEIATRPACALSYTAILAATPDCPELGRMWPQRLAGRIDCVRLPYNSGRIRPAAIVVVAVAVVERHCP
jgi:hypothetical protein